MVEIKGITRKWDNSSLVFVIPKEIVRKEKLKANQKLKALIIKQEMLARGGDAAIPMGTMSGEVKRADVIIIGTILQINNLIKKLKMQSFNLPVISNLLRETLEKEQDVKYLYR